MTEDRTISAGQGGALALHDPLQRFMQEVAAYPMLTPEEELSLARRFHEEGDIEAAKKLVTTHLRLVVKIAMEYRSAYHNVLDLIQEGNVGLLQAVRRFDPKKGARL
nr:sigma-70 family RNA polymerase sigma factor [bacterium]